MTRHDDQTPTPATGHGAVGPVEGGPVRPPPTVDSHALFDGAREVVIVHGEERYRLRCTRSGKLLLNK